MGILYISELPESWEWVNQNAQDILDSVKRAGGWAKIFPKGVPMWLHKIRNYFNIEPKSLRLVDKTPTDHAMHDIRSHGKMDSFIGKRALTGHVYFDEEVETWYQMSAGGTIYHWGKDVTHPKLEAVYTEKIRGQAGTPVFKFVCPDGTGGSKETIIRNSYSRTTLGETNKGQLVISRIEKNMKYQGSYNFSETAVMGLDEHEKRDVHPHHKDPVYIDPPDRFDPLKDRIFFDYVIARAGGETKKPAAKAATYQDDIRENPVIPKGRMNAG